MKLTPQIDSAACYDNYYGPIDQEVLSERNYTLINGLFTLNARTQELAFTLSGSGYLVTPNFLSTIPEFDDRNGNQAAEYRIGTIKDVLKLHRWSDTCKIETVRSKMVGPASHWFT